MQREAGSTVVVLGAGIQGTTLALALAIDGHSVIVVDATDGPMTRASEVNEGKVHLGHVYARDTTGATAELMLEGALSFAPSIESFVGRRVDWSSMRSTPFTYVQMAESLSSTEELVAHYERLDSLVRSLPASDRSNYVGIELGRLWQPTAVDAVERRGNGFRVTGRRAEPAPPESWEVDHDRVGREVLTQTRQALADLVPSLADAAAASVRGEIIFAHGRSDIDEPDSTLHERSRIGPRWSDGFVSIDTGKFTTAPLFAAQVVAALRDRAGA